MVKLLHPKYDAERGGMGGGNVAQQGTDAHTVLQTQANLFFYPPLCCPRKTGTQRHMVGGGVPPDIINTVITAKKRLP